MFLDRPKKCGKCLTWRQAIEKPLRTILDSRLQGFRSQAGVCQEPCAGGFNLRPRGWFPLDLPILDYTPARQSRGPPHEQAARKPNCISSEAAEPRHTRPPVLNFLAAVVEAQA